MALPLIDRGETASYMLKMFLNSEDRETEAEQQINHLFNSSAPVGFVCVRLQSNCSL